MKIYLDLVVLLNFFFDFLLLYGTSKILKEIVPIKRLVLGSVVASLSVFLLFIKLNSVSLFLIKAGISVGIIFVTFGKKNFIKNISYFYLLSIVLGGSLYLLNVSFTYRNQGILFINNGLSINFILLIIVSPIIIFCYVKEHILYKNTYGNIYEVLIINGSNKYKLMGLLDTGNRLRDPYKGRSVILVNNDILMDGDIVYVPYKALNTTGVIKCYKVDKVIVEEKEFSNCLVGISKDKIVIDGVECILPNIFKEEL